MYIQLKNFLDTLQNFFKVIQKLAHFSPAEFLKIVISESFGAKGLEPAN